MKITMKSIAALLFVATVSFSAIAQEAKVVASPATTATGKIKDATITNN